ncbi:MAG: PKD domain-containing protein [Thermoplasmata archaeon]|nr:PKD domain-containing protein [Thermoplasmata archaeon]
MGAGRSTVRRSKFAHAAVIGAVLAVLLLSGVGAERVRSVNGSAAPAAAAPTPLVSLHVPSAGGRSGGDPMLPTACPTLGGARNGCPLVGQSVGPAVAGPAPPWRSLNVSGAVPPGRDFYAMAYDPADQYVVLFGGYNASNGNDYNDTWTYTHGAWTKLTPSVAPPARRGGSMAYDAADGYLVLYGGIPASNSCCFNDTWTFTAGNWTDVTSSSPNGSNTPGARYVAGFAYDPVDHYLVLYGGSTALGCVSAMNDTWKFVAGNWTLLNDNGTNPGHRGGQMMLWYPPANALLVVGGCDPAVVAGNGHHNDTWEFAGGNWTVVNTPASPGHRGDSWMVWDPVYHYLVLFGGLYDNTYGGNAPINDTWLYLSSGWTNETANLSLAPSARWTFENAGVWDGADGYPLLFGGRDASGIDQNDTWTFNWTLRATLVASRPAVDQNQSVDLVANASGGTFTFTYTYGNLPSDCASSNSTSISCAFNVTGTFPLNVTVTDSAGARVVANLTIQVYPDPLANLTVAPAVIDLGQGVQYTVTILGGSGGVNYTYRTLPPGCAARNAPSVNCTPSAGGTFSSSVRIVDRAGEAVATPNVAIVVHPRPTVSAQTGPTSGTVPFTVNFTAVSSGGTLPVSFVWSFGDGSSNASVANVSHVYLSVGHFVAVVTASDSLGDVGTARVAITVLAPLAVQTVAVPASGIAPLFTNFSTLPSGGSPPYSFLWNFGDGSSSSAVSDPSHVYTTAGFYNATLTVTDSATRTASAKVPIAVIRPLSVAPTANRTIGEIPFNVSFGATILGGQSPYTYLWSFGDGTTSTLAAPSHSFKTAGQFRVGWSVSDALGEQAGSSELIEAVAPLTVTLGPASSTLLLGQSVNFSVTSHGGSGLVSYTWSGLPTGCATANRSTLSCQPTAPGNSTVTVLAVDDLGGRSGASARVEVDPVPKSPSPSQGASNAFASPLTWLAIAAVVVVAAVVGLVLALRRRPRSPAMDNQTAGPEAAEQTDGEVVEQS